MLTITDPVKMKAAAAYNAAADHFDDEALGLWAKYGGRTIERLALQPGATVLDVGCGTGASAIPAAEKVGPTGKVIAVDLADRLLAIARRKAAARKLENIEFRHGDMENLGYPDQFFDAVICVFAIFFVPDVAKQIRELWRMVRPNGQLAITTWGPRVWEPGSTGWWSAVKQLRPDLHASFNPWDRIADPASLRKLFTEAGVAEAAIVAEDGRQALDPQRIGGRWCSGRVTAGQSIKSGRRWPKDCATPISRGYDRTTSPPSRPTSFTPWLASRDGGERPMTAPPFAPILDAARTRLGAAALEVRLPQPRSAAELKAVPDDRYLSQMSLRIFRAGLKHSLVDAKWPAFEEVFRGFEPRRVRAMSDEAVEALLGDARLIRHWGKLKSVRDNAAA